MNCPHCYYRHGWNNETLVFDEGAKGNFYHTSTPMVRSSSVWASGEETVLYACPSCGKTFIEAE